MLRGVDMTRDPARWPDLKHSPGQQHALLREYIGHTWGDGNAFSIKIEDFRPAYKVDGRRRNGSESGKHPIRWFFGRIFLPVRNTVLVGLQMIFGNPPSAGFRTSTVTGPAGCMALAFADANKREQQKLRVEDIWLVWTRNRSALVRVRTKPQFHLETLWQGDGPHRPQFDGPNHMLRWRDGSTVDLSLEAWEIKHFAGLPG